MQQKTLLSIPVFINWKLEEDRNGRLTKVPYSPLDGLKVGTTLNHHSRWASYNMAKMSNGYDGVGFVFTIYSDALSVCGIDIDGHDPDSAYTQSIISLFPNAYIERSPSMEGVHINMLVDASRVPQVYDKTEGKYKLDPKYYTKNPNNHVEAYVAGLTNRYFTYTGNIIQNGADVDQTDEFLRFLSLYMIRDNSEINESGTVNTNTHKKNISSQYPKQFSDEELLTTARNAANGTKFCSLYDMGDISGYESQSNADLALMAMLAFWTGCDAERMGNLFSLSALGQREKWSSRCDYRLMTIKAALRDCHQVYEPRHYITASEDLTTSLKPADYTDVGEAVVLAREYGNTLKYNNATGFIIYTGTIWEESHVKAQGLQQLLTDRQLKEANREITDAHKELAQAETSCDELATTKAKIALKEAKDYQTFTLKQRASGKIAATLTVARPHIEIPLVRLDEDGFKLNTPDGTVELKTGNILKHNPVDFCTKITAVSPNSTGEELFADFLNVITCADKGLESYLQLIAGMSAVGAVFSENLVIAYGDGRNGKSTFFNLLARVLGNYSGSLSAETLTINCRKNKSPEYAELRGKRFVIAAELEEGMRLDTAIVKKLCSTDQIYAEKKFKDPFQFTPTHTLVLYTNHLPRVGTSDAGTWRRLIVVPFNAKIDGSSDIKNYCNYLFHRSGGAVLSWIIEGARRFIEAGFTIEPPQCVKKAIDNYRTANDWLGSFLSERCEADKTYQQKSGELYANYRMYCSTTGDYIRSAADFKAALEGAGYITKKTNSGNIIYGLRLVP